MRFARRFSTLLVVLLVSCSVLVLSPVKANAELYDIIEDNSSAFVKLSSGGFDSTQMSGTFNIANDASRPQTYWRTTHDSNVGGDLCLQSSRWTSLSFSTGGYLYICYVLGSGTISQGQYVSIVCDLTGTLYAKVNDSWRSGAIVFNDMRFWALDQNGQNLTELTTTGTDSTGFALYCAPFTIGKLFISCRTSGQGTWAPSGTTDNYLTLHYKPHVFVSVPDNDMQTFWQEQNDITRQNDNRNTSNVINNMMDTTGSDGVLNNVTQYVTQNAQLGILGQLGQTIGGMFNVVANGSAVNTVRFPGIKWENRYIIDPQEVRIVPTQLEQVRVLIAHFNTGILALAWINGLKKLYERVFLGVKDVVVDSE